LLIAIVVEVKRRDDTHRPLQRSDLDLNLFLSVLVVSLLGVGVNSGNSIFISRTDVMSDELIPISDTLDRGSILVENINLFESEALGLGNAEVGEDETSEASGSPEEEHLWSEVSVFGVDNVWSGITDTKVPQPIGGDGEGHCLCSDGEREDFRSDDPSDWSPSGSEEGNVDADKGYEDLLTGVVVDGDGDTDNGDNVLADDHTGGTDEQETTTSDVVDGPESGEGHADVDDVGGDGDQEWIGDTRVLEEGGSVIEDEVDTSELLPGLDKDTGHGTEENLVRTLLEAIDVRALSDFLFKTQVGLDVLEFGLNVMMVRWNTH